ncbi:MAG: CpaD family pilus assembly lipoprotein [Actinomycetospora chiangmaiensis]|nr:CpaD family pilus assembly lipoprotein [Actinomycetospora chiangmaiensis]
MPRPLHRTATLAALALALAQTACTQEVNAVRASQFADAPQQAVVVGPSVVALPLHTTPDGRALTPASVADLGDALTQQGRLSNQRVTLLTHTPQGDRIARRLQRSLIDRGLPAAQLRVTRSEPGGTTDGSEALTLVSRAVVAEVPDCAIADPQAWTVTPFSAVGALGCANRANLARMVSDPRDLVRPRRLAPGDGIQADAAVGRYQKDNIRELARDSSNFKSN